MNPNARHCQRPLAVTIISGLFVAAGSVGLAYHATEFAAVSPFPYDLVWVLLVRLFAVICGVSLWRGCSWARWGVLAWLAYHVGLSAFHTLNEVFMHGLLLAVIAFFLFRPRVSEFLRGSNAHHPQTPGA